jgi:hypothetical protein
MSLDQMKKVIRQHYQMNRLPTDQEVNDEVKNLLRRDANMSLHDSELALFVALRLDHRTKP